MYNSTHNSKRKTTQFYKKYPFETDSEVDRFRTSIMNSEISKPSFLNALRNSFSAASINYFQEYGKITPVSPVQKQKTYSQLKSTLNSIESKLKKVCNNLSNKQIKMPKKPKQKIPHIQFSQDFQKNRQTVSTMAPVMYVMQQPKTKISQYISSIEKPSNFHPFLINPYSNKNRKNNLYYISEAIRAANQKNSLAVQHINSSIKMLKSCDQYYEIFIDQNKRFNLIQDQKYKGKKTLVLDLDQTLIHCYQNSETPCDLKLAIKIQGEAFQIGINIRPYAITFLKRLAKKFEIIIFTASHKSYADAILDELDPDKNIFSHRLYRNNCTVLPNQLHVKDLRYLNRDLKDMVLVDNAAYSYSFQIENGIPILPFYEGKDFELTALEEYLLKIENVHDVREFNRSIFQLEMYAEFESAQSLIKQLYQSKYKIQNSD